MADKSSVAALTFHGERGEPVARELAWDSRRQLLAGGAGQEVLHREQCLLADLLEHPEGLIQNASLMDPRWFSDPLHAAIYKGLSDLAFAQSAVPEAFDPWVVCERTVVNLAIMTGKQDRTPKEVFDYLDVLRQAAIVEASPTRELCLLVRDGAVRRRATTIAGEIMLQAADAGVVAAELVVASAGRLAELSEMARVGDHDPRAELDHALEIFRNGYPDPINLGFRQLDDILRPQRGDLIVVAAEPGGGKTVFGTNAGVQAALSGRKVLIISLEMAERQIWLRILSSFSGFDARLAGKTFTADESERLQECKRDLQRLDLEVVDSTTLLSPTPAGIEAHMRRFAREHRGLDLVVVDYLQFAAADRPRSGREQELDDIIHRFKWLGVNLKTVVMVLSQWNRDGLKSGRPRLHHLRGSGAIEQASDDVIFLWCDPSCERCTEYAVRMASGGDSGWQRPRCPHLKALVEKNRNGPVGATIQGYLHSGIVRWEELEPGREIVA